MSEGQTINANIDETSQLLPKSSELIGRNPDGSQLDLMLDNTFSYMYYCSEMSFFPLVITIFRERKRNCLKTISPGFITLFLAVCNAVNYFDRGAVGGSLNAISIDFGLDETAKGLLGGSFMLGYMVFCPLFGYMTQFVRGTQIMCLGLFLWVGSAVLAGFSRHFWFLATTRLLLGVGEAAFSGIAPSIIDNVAPPERRSVWLAVYFCAAPIGTSLGFTASGLISSFLQWRLIFFLEAAIMLPFCVMCWFLPSVSVVVENGIRKIAGEELSQKDHEEIELETRAEDETIEKRSFGESVYLIFCNPMYLSLVGGNAAVTFVVGSLSLLGPDYFAGNLGISQLTTTLVFGIVAALFGILGAFTGGFSLDKGGGSQMAAALISVVFVTVATLGMVVAVVTTNAYLCFSLIAISQFGLFGTFSPINGAILKSVPSDVRPLAFSLNVFFIHALGDFPSPILVGIVADATTRRTAMVLLILWTFWATISWSVALIYAKLHPEKVHRDDANDVDPVKK